MGDNPRCPANSPLKRFERLAIQSQQVATASNPVAHANHPVNHPVVQANRPAVSGSGYSTNSGGAVQRSFITNVRKGFSTLGQGHCVGNADAHHVERSMSQANCEDFCATKSYCWAIGFSLQGNQGRCDVWSTRPSQTTGARDATIAICRVISDKAHQAHVTAQAQGNTQALQGTQQSFQQSSGQFPGPSPGLPGTSPGLSPGPSSGNFQGQQFQQRTFQGQGQQGSSAVGFQPVRATVATLSVLAFARAVQWL